MSKFIDVTGNTVAEAIQRGLSELDVSISDVETEVLAQPKSGFFGFGATKARVRITVKEAAPTPVETKKPEKTEKKIEKTEKKIEKTERKEVKKEVKTEKKEVKKPVLEPKTPSPVKTELSEIDIKARDFIDGLLEKMDINAHANILEPIDNNISVEIVGEGLGNVIGRRGDTLDALQYLTSLAVKNGLKEEDKVKVLIDCQNYRQKRRETLEKLAVKMGHKVLKNKRNMTLEPMNPYERRVIHEVLQNFRGVHTYSTGKEPNRRVVVGIGEGNNSNH